MAHIPDGVLSAPVLAAGAAVTLAGCAWGLKRLEAERIPQVAVLSSVFFVASLVHFPVGPSSVHLILNGLVGIMLGWAAFPAIVVALLLQTVLFGFGGLVVLGVNAADMAVPALLCRGLFLLAARSGHRGATVLAAGAAGGLGVLLTALLVSLALAASGQEFAAAARLVVLAHVPVMVVESVFTAAAIGLLLRVRPEFLLRGAAVLALVFAALPAEAHKLKAFATAEGADVSGYAYFSPGGRAQQATVTVTEPDGSLVARPAVEEDGSFRFTARHRVDQRIRVDGGDGHVATYTVTAAELPDTLPGGGEAVSAAAPAAAPAETPDLAAVIERSVARQIRPLREQLDAYQEKVWSHDVLGGLGVIFGLGGVAYGLAERRRRHSQGDRL